jgi:hypothetical protein
VILTCSGSSSDLAFRLSPAEIIGRRRLRDSGIGFNVPRSPFTTAGSANAFLTWHRGPKQDLATPPNTDIANC